MHAPTPIAALRPVCPVADMPLRPTTNMLTLAAINNYLENIETLVTNAPTLERRLSLLSSTVIQEIILPKSNDHRLAVILLGILGCFIRSFSQPLRV